jgi:hypothetical protein
MYGNLGPGAYVNPQTGKPTSKMEAKPNNIFVTKVRELCINVIIRFRAFVLQPQAQQFLSTHHQFTTQALAPTIKVSNGMTLENLSALDRPTTQTSIAILSSSHSLEHRPFLRRRFPKMLIAVLALIQSDQLPITQRRTRLKYERKNQISSLANCRERFLSLTRQEKTTSQARPIRDLVSTIIKIQMIERTLTHKVKMQSSSQRCPTAKTPRSSTLKIWDQVCMRKRWQALY